MAERKRTILSDGTILEEKVKNLLEQVGIPSKLKGYEYFTKAICAYYTNDVKKNIYAYLAQEYGDTNSNIERNMRYALKRAWKSENIKIIYNQLSKPSNIEFIVICSHYLLNN